MWLKTRLLSLTWVWLHAPSLLATWPKHILTLSMHWFLHWSMEIMWWCNSLRKRSDIGIATNAESVTYQTLNTFWVTREIETRDGIYGLRISVLRNIYINNIFWEHAFIWFILYKERHLNLEDRDIEFPVISLFLSISMKNRIKDEKTFSPLVQLLYYLREPPKSCPLLDLSPKLARGQSCPKEYKWGQFEQGDCRAAQEVCWKIRKSKTKGDVPVI